MDIGQWAKDNLVLYSIVLVAVTLLICWVICSKYYGAEHCGATEHGVGAAMAGRTNAAVQTAVLMDKIHGQDGMTVVDKEFEKMMLNSQLADRL